MAAGTSAVTVSRTSRTTYQADRTRPRRQAQEQPTEEDFKRRGDYTLGERACDAYETLAGDGRQAVIDMGRRMAELTIPSVFPPDGYKPGDDIPGNNQSVGALAVNTLASKLMFLAFPPGQPMMKLSVIESNLQPEIDRDPELYGRTQLALSRLEVAHRERAQATALATTYVQYQKALLIGGNALWRHISIDTPTFHLPTQYVVSRDGNGHPMVTILKECVRVSTLDDDVREMILQTTPELRDKREWEREADIYSVCKLKVSGDVSRNGTGGERTWCYWQEYEGQIIEDTEVETDYEDCPMWPGWMVPVFGQNWGRSYCEEYRGDLFTLEAHASALNDGAALAAWALLFVKPGSTTSLRQVKKAGNLEMLSGSATDLSVFRSEKTADLGFVAENFQSAVRRVSAAFLLKSAIQRSGERVTAEEIAQLARDLDEAMGGLYTQVSQGDQRRIVLRFTHLHEEENHNLPPIPKDIVRVGVVTGMDAMGKSREGQNLITLGTTVSQMFPEKKDVLLNPTDFTTRLAAALDIKPDGLVPTQEQADEAFNQQRMATTAAGMLDKAAGPAAGQATKAIGEQISGAAEAAQESASQSQQ